MKEEYRVTAKEDKGRKIETEDEGKVWKGKEENRREREREGDGGSRT